MKVLHVLWDFGQGGAQTYVHDLLRQHQQDGKIESEVLVLSHSGPLAGQVEKFGATTQHLGMKNGRDIKGMLKVRNYLRSCRADVIHSHAHNFAFNWLLRSIKIPKVYTEHGGGLLGGKWQNRWFYKLFGNNYRTFIAISQEMAKVMKRVNSRISDRISVVYNGVDVEQIDATPAIEPSTLPADVINARYRVGIIGRLVPQKGIDIFLDVAAAIHRRANKITFLIVGDGPLKRELFAKARRLGLEKKVFFLGFRPDARRILKIFDVFLFTSNHEPFGIVLTEAMAAEVPVVALHLKGAVPEIIKDGVEGFVVDRRDPILLAEKVLTLLKDSSLKQTYVENARKRVEDQFTIRQNAEHMTRIYMKCF